MASEPPGGASPLDPRRAALTLRLGDAGRRAPGPKLRTVAKAQSPRDIRLRSIITAYRAGLAAGAEKQLGCPLGTRTLLVRDLSPRTRPEAPPGLPRPRDSTLDHRAASAMCTKLSFAKKPSFGPQRRAPRKPAASTAHQRTRSSRAARAAAAQRCPRSPRPPRARRRPATR